MSVDLLVVGAGPTGIAIGAAARQAGLDVVLVDRGALTASILGFPTYMTFFTTRDLLEVGGIPLSVPEDKPDRRQALAYYRGVVDHFRIPLALHEEVWEARRDGEEFVVATRREGERHERRSRAVALATGYFDRPRGLGVEGEDLPWVSRRYLEAYPHFSQDVVIVGGGNSAAEVALDLWRNGARVTLVHRRPALKPTVKYWVKPDLENRIAGGAIAARFESVVTAFRPGGVAIRGPRGSELLPADAAYVLLGYEPDVELQRRCGVRVDAETLVPEFDPETCESNVPGLYIAGTLQAGRDTGRIFIENSRIHGEQIVRHVARRLRRRVGGEESPTGK